MRDRLPRWARVLDAASVAIALFAVVVGLSDGFRVKVLGIRLSATSEWQTLAWALGLTVVRHLKLATPPIYRAFPSEVVGWIAAARRRGWLVDEPWLDASQPPSTAESPVGTGRFAAGVALLFAALTVLMTWPQARHLADAVADPGDPLLNLWAISWVAHTLPTAPTQLFDANIFAPERFTLAYSETLLVPGIAAAPLLWMGVSRVAVYNLILLAGFAASGVGMALLVRELTRRADAAVVAGVAFAFMPFRFDHMAQLQLQQAQWIPLALWALHRVLARGRARDGLWLGAAVAAQLLSCMYYGVYLAAWLTVLGGALLVLHRQVTRSRLAALAAGAALALILFAPAARAYLGARAVVGERGAQEVDRFSASWANYLAAPDTNHFYGWTAAQYGGLELQLFPGILVLSLAALALWPPWTMTRVAYGVGLAFALDMTAGFNGAIYRALYEHVTPFRALRIPALAVVLVGASLAVFAGYGAARLLGRLGRAPVRLGVAATLSALILAESWSTVPLNTIPTAPPAVYEQIVRDAGASTPATLVELPMIHGHSPFFQDQIYMYYSTFHWQRLVNGYSGFFPESYLELAGHTDTFPDVRDLAEIRERGARYVVVHGERLAPAKYAAIVSAADTCGCGLSLLVRQPWMGSEISVYRVE